MTETHIPFQDVVEALLGDQDLPRAHLQYFSDIDPASLSVLMEAWPHIATQRKHDLLSQLEQTAEQDTLVSFEDLARALLDDQDAGVRRGAIRLLLESNDPKLVARFVHLMQGDQDEATRAEAAGALGEFVMLGELDEIPEQVRRTAEQALLAVARGEDAARVRQRALESLGYSSREEVQDLISAAYRRQDPKWVASSLLAMGRSSDERWLGEVLPMLTDPNPRVRLAAVEAAGELSLAPARPILIDLLEEEEEDEIAGAAIWSLSQIGGEDSRAIIETLLDQAEDEDLVDFLQDALENLAFTEDLERFDMLSFTPDDLDEENEE
jgi:HEAT repeat protein